MAALARKTGVRLRPHAKTHKSPTIARRQLDAGAVGICCAKLGEAEVFVDAGMTDIRLPYPINPANADRVSALLDRATVSIVVDAEDVARGWSEAMARAGRTLDVLVKVDVGFHRCGVNPDDADVVERIARIASLPSLRFRGLLSHAGHAYHAHSDDDLTRIVDAETAIVTGLAERLRAKGVAVDEVSVGVDANRAVHHAASGRHRNAPRQLRVPGPDAGRSRRGLARRLRACPSCRPW